MICGFAMWPERRIQDLAGDALDEIFNQAPTAIWLHFNAHISQARDWIQQCARLSDNARQFLLETDDHKRLERSGKV